MAEENGRRELSAEWLNELRTWCSTNIDGTAREGDHHTLFMALVPPGGGDILSACPTWPGGDFQDKEKLKSELHGWLDSVVDMLFKS